MKTSSIRSVLLTIVAISGVALTLGCLMPPMGSGGRGDRYEDRDSGRGGHGGDRQNHDGDRGETSGDQNRR